MSEKLKSWSEEERENIVLGFATRMLAITLLTSDEFRVALAKFPVRGTLYTTGAVIDFLRDLGSNKKALHDSSETTDKLLTEVNSIFELMEEYNNPYNFFPLGEFVMLAMTVIFYHQFISALVGDDCPWEETLKAIPQDRWAVYLNTSDLFAKLEKHKN